MDGLAVLFARARPLAPATAVEVRRVGREDGRRFADLLLEGHGVPPDARAVDAPGITAAASRHNIAFYIASVGGRDVAAGVLAVHDGIGYLANASTLPTYRRRGCQTALVARRVADAASEGCDLVASMTSFGSASQRTLERPGFRIAYTKTVWRLGERA